MEQSELIDFVTEELARAVEQPLETFYLKLSPGIFLLSWPVLIGAIGLSVIDLAGDLASAIARVPALVLGRVLLARAPAADSTKVVTLERAKKHAIQIALTAAYNIAGTGVPPSLGLYQQVAKTKGVRARFIKAEERQLIGRIAHKLFGIIRAPTTYIIALTKNLIGIAVGLMALGAAFAVWELVDADWSRIALSQDHKRKRLTTRVNKRL